MILSIVKTEKLNANGEVEVKEIIRFFGLPLYTYKYCTTHKETVLLFDNTPLYETTNMGFKISENVEC